MALFFGDDVAQFTWFAVLVQVNLEYMNLLHPATFSAKPVIILEEKYLEQVSDTNSIYWHGNCVGRHASFLENSGITQG